MSELEKKLAALLNEYDAEHGSDSPDYVLAMMMMDCMKAWNRATIARDKYYGKSKNLVYETVVAQNIDARTPGYLESDYAIENLSYRFPESCAAGSRKP